MAVDIYDQNRSIQSLQTTVQELENRLRAVEAKIANAPFLDGQLVEAGNFLTGVFPQTITVHHGLERQPRGWFLLNTVFDSATAGIPTTAETIYHRGNAGLSIYELGRDSFILWATHPILDLKLWVW